jgi:pimeloyl-ACP methyl ester carboxylesterase
MNEVAARSRFRWRSIAAVAVALVVMAGCDGSSTGPDANATTRADFAGQVDLGNGRSMYLECRGHGTPTVVLVGGLGERADNWMTTNDTPPEPGHSVFPNVAKATRVCAYDRPGTGTAKVDRTGFDLSRSTPVTRPATAKDSASDLHRLLTAAGARGPYVLVGHSLGGPIVRIYAGAHPNNVAGLVLVDALSEDLGDGLTPAQLENFERLNDPTSQGRPAGSEQTLYTTAVVPQVRDAPPVPDVPVIVLSADQWPFTADVIATGHASGQLPAFVTQDFTDALWASQLRAQDELAAKFPHARHVTTTNASHYIHLDNPRLVINSIRDIVEKVRSSR